MSITTANATSAAGRVDGADWDRITEEVNSLRLRADPATADPQECARIAGLPP